MDLEKEIRDFKNIFFREGMYMETYLTKKKELLNRIDCLSEEKLKFFMYLLYLDLITREQYLDIKNKIDNLRKYYKSILSFY